MTRTVTVAAIQASYGPDMAANIEKTAVLVREAARQGAQVILPSELFQGIYFCSRQDAKWFETAFPAREHPCVLALKELARELARSSPSRFSSKTAPAITTAWPSPMRMAKFWASTAKATSPTGPAIGEILLPPRRYRLQSLENALRHHRRRHLLGPVVPRGRARHGAGGRRGAVLSNRHRLRAHDPALDTHKPWQRAMQGHAVSNAVPVVAANRIGTDENEAPGSAFTDIPSSRIIRARTSQSLGEDTEGVLLHAFNLSEIAHYRAEWGFFRDRRPDLYAKSLI